MPVASVRSTYACSSSSGFLPDARTLEPYVDVPTPEHAERAGILAKAAAEARAERDRVESAEFEAFEAFAS
ncbi:MAG: hypothetical protein ACKORL_00340, partial [Phycisphaerales bacterium]